MCMLLKKEKVNKFLITEKEIKKTRQQQKIHSETVTKEFFSAMCIDNIIPHCAYHRLL